MLLPFRVKNPPKRFPVVTASIIALNVIVFGFTSDYFLVIKDSALESYCFGFGVSPIANFFSACFLHLDLLHLAGNMLFLWIFGPPVEDRLGKLSYVVIYLTTGFAGDLLQAVFDQALLGQVRPGLGASGCVMGILGAYWYVFSWSKVCVFYWFGMFWMGVWEVQAIWIIGLFVLLDVFEGAFFGAMGLAGGVANFAHVGGAVIGALMVGLMRVKRDTEAMSEAKAIQADTKDLQLVPLDSLVTMLDEDPENLEALRALVSSAYKSHRYDTISRGMEKVGARVIEGDPQLAAWYLADFKGPANMFQPLDLLRLARRLCQIGEGGRACQAMALLATQHPTAPETETALFEMARHHWETNHDAQSAQQCLAEMERLFPNGAMKQFRDALKRRMAS